MSCPLCVALLMLSFIDDRGALSRTFQETATNSLTPPVFKAMPKKWVLRRQCEEQGDLSDIEADYPQRSIVKHLQHLNIV